MTIHIPKAIAIPLLVLLGAAFVGAFIQQAPDIWKYIREEGM